VAERTALLIRCSQDEARRIRREATGERRTLSGYVLNIVLRSLPYEELMRSRTGGRFSVNSRSGNPAPEPGPRSAVLIRCLQDEAERIRAAAGHRNTTISAFVLHSLKRSWSVKEAASAALHNTLHHM